VKNAIEYCKEKSKYHHIFNIFNLLVIMQKLSVNSAFKHTNLLKKNELCNLLSDYVSCSSTIFFPLLMQKDCTGNI